MIDIPFNIGDEVYYIEGDKIKKGRLQRIEIEVAKFNLETTQRFKYTLRPEPVSNLYRVYASPQALTQHLIKEFYDADK